jgi:hypothetical protein
MHALGSIYQDNETIDSKTIAGDFYYELAQNELNQAAEDVTDYQVIGSYLLLFKYCKGRFGGKLAIKYGRFRCIILTFRFWTYVFRNDVLF